MMYLKLLPALILLTLSASGQTQTTNPGTNQNYPSYIIFGVFCGKCPSHCATMYCYNMIGNSNTLLVDSTDSYFKKHGKLVFKTLINDIYKYHIVNKLVDRIPKTFLTTTETKQTFGCPDCKDWCGIYFELGQGATRKKFYIDYRTSELEKEVKDFAEAIKETLTQLNKKN